MKMGEITADRLAETVVIFGNGQAHSWWAHYLPCRAPQNSCPSLSTQGIMLVYDITNEKSFDNIRNWIRNIEEVRVTLCLLSWAGPQTRDMGNREGWS